MRSLQVAVIDEELPYPLTSGKRIRTFNLLKQLAHRHRITIICHRNPDREESDSGERMMHRLGIETRVVERSIPSKSGPGFYARLAGNLLSPLPYSVATHTSLALTQAIADFASRERVDLWHCEWTPYAASLRNGLGESIGDARWLIMAHNVESLIWRRYTDIEAHPIKRWYIRKQWRKFERFERWAYSAATTTIAVSPDDAKLMRERLASPNPGVVENGVDTDYFRPQRDVEREPAKLLFLGGLDWRPNVDAVHLLLDAILPAVQRKVPEATLMIVGRRPGEELRKKTEATPGATLFADVADVRPFLATAGMLVVPLRIGGGSRLKILEALATVTPVVSTRIGAEGLRLVPGRDLVVTEGIEPLADAIVQAVRRPDEIQEMAERGHREILAHYDWRPLSKKLETKWLEVALHSTRSLVSGSR